MMSAMLIGWQVNRFVTSQLQASGIRMTKSGIKNVNNVVDRMHDENATPQETALHSVKHLVK
jgi:hypothetical protein